MRYRNKVQDDPVPFRSVRRLLGSISPIHGRQSGLFPLHKSEVDKGGRVSRVSILARSVANDPEGGYSFSTVFSGGVLAEHGNASLYRSAILQNEGGEVAGEKPTLISAGTISRHDRAYSLWNEVLKYSTEQTQMFEEE